MTVRRILVFYLLIFIILLTSCLPEKKLAREYFETKDHETFLILTPGFLYKESLKDYELDDNDSLTEEEKDSLLFYSSLYLQYINDSSFIDTLETSLATNLQKLGFKVYREGQMQEFLGLEEKAYIINIAQILLEEFVYPYEAQTVIFDEVVSVNDIGLNALAISIWFEMNPINTEEEAARVLFASDEVYENIEGRFTGSPFFSAMQYRYSVDSLKMEDIYTASEILGRKYALYFNDYFLNRYLLRTLPAGYDLREYYHWDPAREKIYPIDEEYRFIEMDLR
jgi:hypothetical protein